MHVSFHNNYGCNGSTQSVALTSVIAVNKSSNLKVSSFTKNTGSKTNDSPKSENTGNKKSLKLASLNISGLKRSFISGV